MYKIRKQHNPLYTKAYQEYQCIKYLIKKVTNKITIKKLFDGCKSDIVVKPKFIKKDK